MADYVTLAGVGTWYDEHGDGDPLVLLHPGGGGVEAPTLSADDVGQVEARTLVMVGDDDEVRLEHAIEM